MKFEFYPKFITRILISAIKLPIKKICMEIFDVNHVFLHISRFASSFRLKEYHNYLVFGCDRVEAAADSVSQHQTQKKGMEERKKVVQVESQWEVVFV